MSLRDIVKCLWLEILATLAVCLFQLQLDEYRRLRLGPGLELRRDP